MWIDAFVVTGVVLRLVRFGLVHPLWRDEAYLACNILERDFAGLTRPLDFLQVCPVGFLWAEKGMSLLFSFSEWALRIVPTVASVGSLFLMRHLACRMMKGVAPVLVVAILAIAYTPIRHGGEIKPYATDFLVALGLITLAVEWVLEPKRAGWLWGLALLGPVAVGISNPSIFVAGGVGLVLTIRAMGSRSLRVIVPVVVYDVVTVAMFLVLYRLVNSEQSRSVMEGMRPFWANAFPPRSPVGLVVYMVRTHTSQMFAYPAGGDVGASTLTTILFAVGVVACYRRGSRTILALLLAPFGFGLIAAFAGRYPYGGSARVMQYVAPSIIVLAGLGLAALLDRIARPRWRNRVTNAILIWFQCIGLVMLVGDVIAPYKTEGDRDCRAFARRFWADEAKDAEILCARSDLHLPLDQLNWRRDRAALYLCYQAIAIGRSPHARLDLVSADHPLRLVVFGESPDDARLVTEWIAEQSDRYHLRARRQRVLNKGVKRGKASDEDLYVVYELVPVTEVRAMRP